MLRIDGIKLKAKDDEATVLLKKNIYDFKMQK